MIIIDRKNGSAVKYSESPLELPNGGTVIFKIEGYEQPEGVSEDEMAELLKDVENRINTEILERVGKGALSSRHPHFYISCPYPDKADLLVRIFNMSYVEELSIMLYPADDNLKFRGSWEDYMQYKAQRREKVLVVNADETEEDESMIQYWVDHTHYGFHVQKYLCPATGDLLGKDGLDGAHVKIVSHPEMGLFITPLQKGFNRSHSHESFYVKPEYLVEAPQ